MLLTLSISKVWSCYSVLVDAGIFLGHAFDHLHTEGLFVNSFVVCISWLVVNG